MGFPTAMAFSRLKMVLDLLANGKKSSCTAWPSTAIAFEGNITRASTRTENGRRKVLLLRGVSEWPCCSDGYGVFTVSSGERYAGHWSRDSYDGLGRFYAADGTIEEGVWRADELVEQADASDAVSRAEKASEEAKAAAKVAEGKSSEALDAAELARQAQDEADAADLEASRLEGRAYRALYDYQARSEEEASLEEGDTIVNAESVDDPLWFNGRVQRTGQTGLIPLEYVEQISTE